MAWLQAMREPIDTPTVIGIAVVFGSNVVISLALNCQKLAHKRLKLQNASGSHKSSGTASDTAAARLVNARARSPSTYGVLANSPSSYQPSTAVILETEPLLQRPPLRKVVSSISASNAAVMDAVGNVQQPVHGIATILPRRSSSIHAGSRKLVPKAKIVAKQVLVDEDSSDMPVVDSSSNRARPVATLSHAPTRSEQGRDSEEGHESDYLKSKLWWLGFTLMNVGEFGNFLSYAYAPASVIAPLGASALVANCFFAPLILHERFRKRDILGIGLTILGAVTVISAAKTSDVRLDPAGLITAITQRVFLIYSGVCVACAVFLVWLSEGSAGENWIGVDIGICALFGGFTVLSTKALSTLISTLGLQAFKYWITYPVILILISTGVAQIKYLNRALMRFDSKAVVPTQFVGFNLAAIVGSAILYRDFENVTFHQMLSFVNGIGMTFLGVWILAARASVVTLADEDEDESHDDRDVEAGDLPITTIVPVSSMPIGPRKKPSTPSLGMSPGQQLLVASEGHRVRTQSQDTGSVSARRRTLVLQ